MNPEPMFRGPLRWASNFYMRSFFVPGLGAVVESGEHGYNAYKSTDPEVQAWILAAPSPWEAKRRGTSRSFQIRPGWDRGGRVRAMQSTLLAKFADPELADLLAGTGDLMLVETNDWHDNFFGDCFCGNVSGKRPRCLAPGTNMLGELLMALRCRTL